MSTKRINLNELARKIHKYALENRIHSITTWWMFAEIKDEWRFGETEEQIYRAIKKGQKLGLFSEGYWTRIGMTPWSGSARRARYYDIMISNPKNELPIFIRSIDSVA